MKALLPLIVLLGLWALIAWMRRGHGGRIRKALQQSEHDAWRDAVEDAEARVRALRAMEPPLRPRNERTRSGPSRLRVPPGSSPGAVSIHEETCS